MSALILLEYQSDWPVQFQQVAAELGALFAPAQFPVEHIGSTSVAGLCSKPVLDVMLGATDLAEVECRLAGLARLGYTYRPEYEAQLPDRRYFVRPASSTLRVHLHAVVAGGLLWTQHLKFRDSLRGDSRLKDQYDSLKRGLAVTHATDKAAYSQAKGPFIQQALR